MSDGWLIVLWFLSCLVAWVLVIWASIRVIKRKMERWNSNSAILFIMTIGNFGERQIDMWRRRGGYDERQAKIIIRYQAWCLLGLFLAFGATM
jgi:hypothetical protein